MTPDIDAIVAADRAASREIDAVSVRLAERLRAQQTRLAETRASQRSAETARIEAEAAAVERAGAARTADRRSARAALRDQHRRQAETAVAGAVAAYVAIVAGAPR